MTVIEISNITQFKEIINKDKVTIFDFWADWCGPCKTISPIFEGLSDKSPSVEFYKVNIDAAPEIAEEVSIRAMPTFIAFRNGSVVGKVVGAIPQQLHTLVESHVIAV